MSRLQLARELRQKGDNVGAISLIRQHIEQNPEDLVALHNLSAALGDIGESTESAQVMKQAIDKGLNKSPSWLVYARALTGTGDTQAAISAYQKCLSFDTSNGEVQRELSQLIWMATGDYEAALAYLSECIAVQPNSSNLKILRAELSGQMENYENQYTWLKSVFQKTPHDLTLRFFMSKAALANKQFAEALELGQSVFEQYQQDLSCAIHYINCLLANAKADEALTIVQNTRKLFPADQHLIALLGTCWRILEDEKYIHLFDYQHLVKQMPLGVPEGWSSLSQYINDLESELDEEHCFRTHPFYQSVRNGSQISSITSSTRPAMRAFEQAVEEPLKVYISEFRDDAGILTERSTGRAKLLSAWSVKLFSDGYHVNHVHQEGWLSSACHIRLAQPDGKNNDSTAGWFKLGEPGPKCVPELGPEKLVEPKRGHIVLFPSYIWHGTVPIVGDCDRLTVAADFQPA